MQFKTKLSFCLLAMYFLLAISVAADDRREPPTPALKEVSETTKVVKHEDGDSKSAGVATKEIKNSKTEIPTHHHHIHVHKAVTTESPNSLPRREEKDYENDDRERSGDEKAELQSDDIDPGFNKSRSGANEVLPYDKHKSRQGYDPPEHHNRPIPRGGADYVISRNPNRENWCHNTRKPYERPGLERWTGEETNDEDDESDKDNYRGNPKSMSDDEGDDLEDDKNDSPPAPYSGPDDRYDDDSEDDGLRRVEKRRQYPPKLDSLDNTGRHDEAEDQDDDNSD